MANVKLDGIKKQLEIAEEDTHATPESGVGAWYNKTDGLPYFKNDGGTEYDLAGGQATLTTKGDLLSYDTDVNRLAVGTDTQGLVADSADAQGVVWGDVSNVTTQAGTPSSTPPDEGDVNVDTTNDRIFISAGSAANTDWRRADAGYALLASGTETSDAASVTISGWPTDNREYHKFILDIVGMESDQASNFDNLLIQFNSDTTATNYDNQSLLGNTSTATASSAVGTVTGVFAVQAVAGVNVDANFFGMITIDIYRPEDTSDYKQCKWQGGILSGTSGETYAIMGAGAWENNNAITSITFLPGSGTTFLIGGAGEPSALDWRLYGAY
jgi:hypothetical protein